METRHVYRIGPWRRRFLYGIWACFALPLTIGGLVSREPALLLVAAIFSAIALPLIVWAERMARLTLTPEGIELRQIRATLRASWENVEEIRLVRGTEGFVLKEAMQGGGADRYAITSQVVIRGAPLFDEHRRRLLAEKRFIPIEAFGYWLRHGDLRQVLNRYIPDVVQRADAAAAAAHSVQKLSTGAIFAISAIIVLSIGAGILVAVRGGMEPAVLRVLLALVAFALAVAAVRNVLSAVNLFRAGRLASGLLWGGLAVIQLLLVLALLARVFGTGN